MQSSRTEISAPPSRSKVLLMAVLCALIAFALASMIVAGAPKPKDKTDERTVKQIIVRVHRRSSYFEAYTVANLSVRAGGRPLHDMGVYLLKKSDANHWLAEIKCNDCEVIPIFDEDVQLGVITQISEIVTNAGFRNIHPFVYWKKTGQMSELQFGPSTKFTLDVDEIERRLEKASD